MSELDILSLAVGAFIVWLVFKYYWLRVLSCLLLLAVWGSFSIGAPIFLSVLNVRDASYFQAILTFLLGLLPRGIWFIGAHGAYKCYSYQVKFAGGFWQPWNAE